MNTVLSIRQRAAVPPVIINGRLFKMTAQRRGFLINDRIVCIRHAQEQMEKTFKERETKHRLNVKLDVSFYLFS